MAHTTVYFVRHAQSDISIKEDAIRPLTLQGMSDSKKITKFFEDKNIDVICSSPYKRTIDTVKDFADSIGQEIVLIEDFRERKAGSWVEDFKAYSKQQWEDLEYKLDGGESLKEVQERNVKALRNVVQQNEGKRIVIGTHGTAMSTIINYFDKAFGYEEFWGLVDKMPYIVCFQFEGNRIIKIEEAKM
ncbi:histidine phosphatase family protein [Paenibacillus sp. sgz500958]|uniref:histidine phosphatase family protein n=1 Tax=Paenibacillus sp. sgz500958 TaxID=3242475 RepID=UPI0036D2A595